MSRPTRQLNAALVMVGLALTGCGAEPDRRSPDAASSSTITQGSVIETSSGEPALWMLADVATVGPSTVTFAAEVSRLGCNSGRTGTVLPPVVSYGRSDVTVLFSVDAARPGGANCLGNRPEPFTVELDEPLGDRDLVDGQCLLGAPGEGTADCLPDGVRRQG